MVRMGLWGASLAVVVALGCGGSGGGGGGGTINVATGGVGGTTGSAGEAAGSAGATGGAPTGLAGTGGKGGTGGRGASSSASTGTLTVTLDGTAVSYPSIVGGFNGVRVDVSGYSADLTRSFALSVYPNGMASGSFTCAVGGATSMTMSYSVNFTPMPSAATAAGCMGTFTMIPTSADAVGRFVGTFSGTVGSVAATAGTVDVTLTPN
jgi:hypothetical protein